LRQRLKTAAHRGQHAGFIVGIGHDLDRRAWQLLGYTLLVVSDNYQNLVDNAAEKLVDDVRDDGCGTEWQQKLVRAHSA
jgi:hypothetical protein